MEYKAVPPGDHCTRKRTVREAVTCHEERRIGWKEPDVDEVENRDIIAEVEEEVVP
jgi:hypothetical protein